MRSIARSFNCVAARKRILVNVYAKAAAVAVWPDTRILRSTNYERDTRVAARPNLCSRTTVLRALASVTYAITERFQFPLPRIMRL